MSPRLADKSKGSAHTATVTARVSPAMRRKIELIVLKRRMENEDLPPRWGVSDYVREVLEEHFQRNPDG